MSVTLIINAGPDALKPKFKLSLQTGLATGVKMWEGLYKPKHFKTLAYTRYSYKLRTIRYQRDKKRLKGHSRPLVFSRDLKRLTDLPIMLSVGRTKAKGKMSVPWYVSQTPKTRNAPNMVDEILTTRNDEVEMIARKVQEHIHNGLLGVNTKKIVR